MSSPVLLEVVLRDGETTDRLIKRFLKKYKNSDLLDLFRWNQTFHSDSEIEREKKRKKKYLSQRTQKETDKNVKEK